MKNEKFNKYRKQYRQKTEQQYKISNMKSKKDITNNIWEEIC